MRRRQGRKRLTAEHKNKISRTLRAKGRKTGEDSPRLKNLETASRIVRNLSLSAETPSKIARNASLTAGSLSRLNYGIDRNLGRLGQTGRTADAVTRSIKRFYE